MRDALLSAAALAALAAGHAEAAGFALKEQSATAQGNAFAGATAGAEDISYMFFNPAALGRMEKGSEIMAVGNMIMPTLQLQAASARTAAGTPVAGSIPGRDLADDEATAAIYAAMKLGSDWRAGIGINAPFGMGTDYPDRWVGRYYATDSSVKAVGVTPALAYTPLKGLTFGGGIQLSHADASLSNAIDFGSIGAGAGIPGSIPGAQDGFARIDGDDWNLGYTLGVLAEPMAGTRIGIGYRSKVDHKLEGDADFSLRGSPSGAALAAATGAFSDTGASAELELPASASIGIHQEITDSFAMMAEAAWTNWSAFDELRIEFDNPAQPDSVTEHKWQDAWFLALGATWRPAEAWVLRAGVAYDQTPVQSAYATPRIPDGDRTWLSFGVGWMPSPWLSLDASLTHIFVEDTDVRLRAADTGNASRGDLDAEYESSIDLVAVSARVFF